MQSVVKSLLKKLRICRNEDRGMKENILAEKFLLAKVCLLDFSFTFKTRNKHRTDIRNVINMASKSAVYYPVCPIRCRYRVAVGA